MTNRIVWKTEDLPQEWIEAISRAEMSGEYAYLDALLDPAHASQPSNASPDELMAAEPTELLPDRVDCQVRRQ